MQLLGHIFDVLFPTTCAACGQVLADGERQLCLDCLVHLGTDPAMLQPDNLTERLLLGHFEVEAAGALAAFRKGNTAQAVVHAMKFHSCTELCLTMGRLMGAALAASHRFDGVDLLLPVPLHWTRRLHRGYNQSSLLCRGIASAMPRPVVEGALVRNRATRQQSLQRHDRRAANVAGAFSVRQPQRLAGRHVLLVDDVVTTGATLGACAEALQAVPGLKLSVAAFSLAH